MKKVTTNPQTNKDKITTTPNKKLQSADVVNNSSTPKATQSTQSIKSAVSSNNNSNLVNSKKSSESKTNSSSTKGKATQPLRKESDSKSTLENQPKKEEKKENLKNEQLQNSNKYHFLLAFDDKLEDFYKFATLSRQARNRIPRVLKKINYSKEYKELKDKFLYDVEGRNFCQEILEINQRYLDLIDNKYQKIKESLQSFEKDKFKSKDDFYEVLHIGVNFLSKTRQQKSEIIPFILKNGIKNVFQDLQNEILRPVTSKVNLPGMPSSNKETSLTKLIIILYQHIVFQQKNKFSPEQQKSKLHPYKRLRYFEKYYQLEKKIYLAYNRPIGCLKKTSNVFNYVNKNNIQIITKFLTFQEIINLIQTSKSMHSLVMQGLQSLIEQEKQKRDNVLQTIQMSDKEAKSIMYMKHYETFQRLKEGVMFASYFEYKPLLEMFQALYQVFPSDNSRFENNQNFKDSYDIFYLSIPIEKLQFENGGIIDKVLQQYTDSYTEKEISLPDHKYYRTEIILLQKFFKGLKLFIEVNKKDQLQQLSEKYLKNIFKLDNNIYKYELIAKQNKELLEFFTIIPRAQLGFIKRTKGIPRYLFK